MIGLAALIGAAHHVPSGALQTVAGGAPPPPAPIRVPTGEPVPITEQPRPQGDVIFSVQRPLGAPLVVPSQPLAADAVIASETVLLLPLSFQLAAPVVIGPPFNSSYAAGTQIKRLVRDGATRNCVRHRGPYSPAHDEKGEIYPGLCLEDRDGDGRFESAILEPYHPQRAPERVVGIPPVRLEPSALRGEDDPDAFRVQRRIRVTHVDATGAQFIAEQGAAVANATGITSFYGRPEESLILPLQDGASGSVGGVQLRLQRAGEGWQVIAAGQLAPWLELRENDSLVVVGGMPFRRRL